MFDKFGNSFIRFSITSYDVSSKEIIYFGKIKSPFFSHYRFVYRSNWLILLSEAQTKDVISLVSKVKKTERVNCSAWRICFLTAL